MADLKLREAMGLTPWRERYAQAKVALGGEQDVPATRWGLSSLRLLRPKIGIPLWRGKEYLPRTVILTNLFNHRQTPVALGWSVKKSQVEDFRGRDLTYDSHNGTDLSIPIGTTVVTAAPGQVVRVQSEFNRGGLKIFIDHGAGLMTCCAHLGRSLVEEGQAVGRGEPIAISGYSGLDGFVTYPFGVPHVHFNTWLDGESIDPFARPGETSMWRGGFPVPVAAGARGEAFVPSEYDEERVAGLIAGCKTPAVREHLASLSPISVRAAHAIIASNYYPTRFVERPNPYAEAHPRSERLDMPFRADDFDRALFVDEI